MGAESEMTKRSVFGEVVEELMKSRCMDVNRESLAELAERSGLDPERFEERMSRDTDEHIGYLNGLAKELTLRESEKVTLAQAYAFEKSVYRPDDLFSKSPTG